MIRQGESWGGSPNGQKTGHDLQDHGIFIFFLKCVYSTLKQLEQETKK